MYFERLAIFVYLINNTTKKSNPNHISKLYLTFIKNKFQIYFTFYFVVSKLIRYFVSTNQINILKQTNMQTIEIEIHEASLTANIATIAYTIYDGETVADVNKQQIQVGALLQYIIDSELNWLYITAPDVLTEVDAFTYLTDNLTEVVKGYLIETYYENILYLPTKNVLQRIMAAEMASANGLVLEALRYFKIMKRIEDAMWRYDAVNHLHTTL